MSASLIALFRKSDTVFQSLLSLGSSCVVSYGIVSESLGGWS